jgi:glycosyltransferase involved in cell wall biosynthesis
MRVLHLAAGNLFGGVESYLLALARLRHLCKEMEPHFGLCFPGRLRDELTATGVPVYDLGAVRASRPWTVLRGRWRLKRTLRENGIDVVVTHGCWPHALFAPVVRRAGVRLVNMVHGELTGDHWLDRRAARTPPDLVIANSRFAAESAKAVFPQSSVSVVHPPLGSPEPFDRGAARARVRAEFETAADAVVMLMVSRIEELKGHAVLLESLGRLRDNPGWTCWVVGGAQRPHEVELLASLRRELDRLGLAEKVRFVGQRRDVPAVMSAADIYCQPNTAPEGFGLTFIEALRAGLPVVTSGIGGAAEIVDGSCGVLCPPGDAVAVAAALSGLMADPHRRQALGVAGPARALELCDPAKQVAALGAAIRPGKDDLES